MRQFGKSKVLKYVFGALMSATILWSFMVPDAPMFQYPGAARIFFWHFPMPMMLSAFMFMGCYFSLRHFVKLKPLFSPETDASNRDEWDLRASSALEVGLIFGCLTMVSGMLFSGVMWGAYWQWDPRQTSFLLALLIYAAYFALRAAFTDPDKRATNSAAYMAAAVLPLTFLIFIFPHLPWVAAASLHPSDTIIGGQLKGGYLYVTLTLLALVSILSAWIYQLRVRVGLLALNQKNGNLETYSGHPRPSVVARTVRVSDENRLETE